MAKANIVPFLYDLAEAFVFIIHIKTLLKTFCKSSQKKRRQRLGLLILTTASLIGEHCLMPYHCVPFYRINYTRKMKIQIHDLGSTELVALYHKTNSDIRKNLIDGASWVELKDMIALLTDLSKEISKGRISLNENGSPADSPLR